MFKKTMTVLVSVLLAVALLVTVSVLLISRISGSDKHFTGQAEEYYQELLNAGFPEDYAVSLTELHLLHPAWSFTPLPVSTLSEANIAWDWKYIISEETKEASTNLISASDTYQSYRHATNTQKYDSDHYQASVAAVSYFMDPRNFLNEADIFQFYDLATQSDNLPDSVEAVLNGTFMDPDSDSYLPLENGLTYSEYFLKVGKELSMNPVYLAVKVRQEQGVNGTSQVNSGHCGSVLWNYYSEQTQTASDGKMILAPSSGYTQEQLLALNGYYNLFNIKASGTGYFQIYYNAMQRAVKGTDSMSAQWDGSPSWNTRWKSIYGGAVFLRGSYIGNYQNTVYLQKFNVDPRAKDGVSHQYMQNVGGAMSEARSLYQSFASIGVLDTPCNFLIPVYRKMPSNPCTDPAKGSCSYYAVSSTKYSYSLSLRNPSNVCANNMAVYQDCSITLGKMLNLEGTVTHSYGVKGLEYRWDNEDWLPLSETGEFSHTIPADVETTGAHILIIRGTAAYDNSNSSRKNCFSFLCAVFNVEVTPPPSVTLSLTVGNRVTERTVIEGNTETLPVCDASDFIGWLGTNGSLQPSGASVVLNEDVGYTALFLDFRQLEGASLPVSGTPYLRFSAALKGDLWEKLSTISSDTVRCTATIICDGAESETGTLSCHAINTYAGKWYCFTADTPSLGENDLRVPCSARFYLSFRYTDGSMKKIAADGNNNVRTVTGIAADALADVSCRYPDEVISFLRTLIDKN